MFHMFEAAVAELALLGHIGPRTYRGVPQRLQDAGGRDSFPWLMVVRLLLTMLLPAVHVVIVSIAEFVAYVDCAHIETTSSGTLCLTPWVTKGIVQAQWECNART